MTAGVTVARGRDAGAPAVIHRLARYPGGRRRTTGTIRGLAPDRAGTGLIVPVPAGAGRLSRSGRRAGG